MNSTLMFVVCVLAIVAVAQAEVFAEDDSEQFFFESTEESVNSPRLLVGGYYSNSLVFTLAQEYTKGDMCTTIKASGTTTATITGILKSVADGTTTALNLAKIPGFSLSGLITAVEACKNSRRVFNTSNFGVSGKMMSPFTVAQAQTNLQTAVSQPSFLTNLTTGVSTALGTNVSGAVCKDSAGASVTCSAGTAASVKASVTGSSAVTAFMSMTMMAVVGYFMLL